MTSTCRIYEVKVGFPMALRKDEIIFGEIKSATKRNEYLFTSESVSEGHPDKICDQISDAVVDEYLGIYPESRVAAETVVTTNRIIVLGEVRCPEVVSKERIEQIARETVKKIGYEQEGFHWQKAKVEILLHEQSADIAMGVDSGSNKDEGAGDQGLMFGYACDETDALMPAPIYYSHKILKALSEARHSGEVKGLEPDAKSQVTFTYENGAPKAIDAVLVSTQHTENTSQEEVREIVKKYLKKVLPEDMYTANTRLLTNPTGKFVIGGPDGDSGLTGRKIIVDTYGGAAPHGGGAFSGKDPTKVDRSAAYMARYLAKNVVAAGLAQQCDIQIAYAIGVSDPVSFYVNTFGSKKVENHKLEARIKELVSLTPRGIREHLKLNRPIYNRTASYGHFGRTPDADGGFSWEKTDLVDGLKDLL
ncbi:MAG: metK2 [Rickettsiaceae bacterium]|jgi:S-adenosylmethionine synthetase|nr:metK2 [Rickettsiaceae bacterium]